MRGRRVLMDSFVAHGVRHIFGNPGTTETPLLDSLPAYPQIDYVMTLHEGVAVGAASFCAQAGRRVTVANLHVAPGLGNGIGALYGALKANSPVVVTAGQQDTRMRLRNPVLGHDLVAMAAPVAKWSVQVERADEIAPILRRAFKVATDAPQGPVFVSLPIDVMEQETAVEAGAPDMADDPRFADMKHRTQHIDVLYGRLGELVARRTSQDWLDTCLRLDIPAGPVLSLDALQHDPHLRAVGFFQQIEDADREIAGILKLDPLQFRMKNAAKQGTKSAYGPTFPKIGYGDTLKLALEHPHYQAPLGANQGRGVASGFWFNAGGESSAQVNVAEDGSIIGMKYSSYDMPDFIRTVKLAGDKIAILSGEEPLFATHVAIGAVGGVLASASIHPKVWLEIFALARQGKLPEALKLQDRIDPIVDAIFIETNPGPLKSYMALAGMPVGGVRLPLEGPSPETLAKLKAAAAGAKAINLA